MAHVREPETALLLVGILAAGLREMTVAGDALVSRFGPACRGSRLWRFDNTRYYEAELGPSPFRGFLAFPGAFATENIVGCKLATNAMEKELAADIGGSLPRPVNLDPGYLTLAKLVLASAKNFAHRIHIGSGIYAEVTMQYRDNRWRVLPWTFPDFASGKYDAFLTGLRDDYASLQRLSSRACQTARRESAH